MDFQQLTAFDRIVREGSFSQAARELHIAQPTISARLQALEQEVGGTLLNRSNQGVTLTALGVSFLPYARRALAAMIEGTAAVAEAQRGQRGRISIGVLGSLAKTLLAPALASFQSKHPTVECYVRAADHIPMIELLYDGVVELAIVAWPCVQPLTEEIKPLFRLRESVPFVVHHQHPFAQRVGVTQAEITESETRFLLLRWWQITPPEIMQLARLARYTADVPHDIAVYLTREGHTCGLFTHGFVAQELKEGSLTAVPITDLPLLYRDSALVRLDRQSECSLATIALIATIQEQAMRLGYLVDEDV